MAQVTYRANLSAKYFPFISDNYGRSVIVGQQDQNFVRQVVASEDPDKDIGIPQAYYMHNVMPHTQGWQSIGYTQVLPAITGGVANVKNIFLLRDSAENKIYLAVTTDNKFYVCDGTGSPWVYKTVVSAGQITTAYVAGVTYIYVANSGCVRYDWGSGTFVLVSLNAIITDNILGITYAAGYLIAWSQGTGTTTKTVTLTSGSNIIPMSSTTGLLIGQVVTGTGIPPSTFITAIYGGGSVGINNAATASGSQSITFVELPSTVAWSSTIDPTDFSPSNITGAGGGPIESARGAINYCIPHTLGFIVGTADNCVAALFQNNLRYPFQFRELVNSGGMTSLDLVTWDANSNSLYAYTTSGLQLISTSATQTTLPEITDFISGRHFEDFDDTLKVFTSQVLTSPMMKKLSVVCDRYLVMSYGVNGLTHAIVYDLIMKRYGKIKHDHVQVFTYAVPTTATPEIPRQSFAFLQNDGGVTVVDFAQDSPASNGTILLGKYQYVRARLLQLDTIVVESSRQNQSFACTVFSALDGKNMIASIPTPSYNSGLAREFTTRAIGVNHSILFQGGFLMDSLVLQFNIHGKR